LSGGIISDGEMMGEKIFMKEKKSGKKICRSFFLSDEEIY